MADRRRRVILIARFPVAGKVKTRLIPALGADGAAALHRRLVLRTLRTAHALCQSLTAQLEVRCAGAETDEMQQWIGDGWLCRLQCDGDLGQRIAGAFEDSFREGSPATVIIGSDCPALTPETLAAAFDALKTRSVVFGPARDGGYYLIGLRRFVPPLFQGIAWGTSAVLAQSLRILHSTDDEPALLETLDDLDRPDDLAAWREMAAAEEANLSRVSVVIPALNEAGRIAQTLQSARAGSPHEIIVVDGGSTDDTGAIAREGDASIIHSKPGRARQMNAGAARATGNVLLFLHADTRLPPDYVSAVAGMLQQPDVAAGAFRFRVDEDFTGKRLLEWTTNWRSHRRQMPYGDQALFMRRSLFEEMGGFAAMPILEDYEMVRRLRKRGRIVTASQAATTSGRRWQRLGLLRTTVINQFIVVGYRCGVAPARLAHLYR